MKKGYVYVIEPTQDMILENQLKQRIRDLEKEVTIQQRTMVRICHRLNIKFKGQK